jgi:hypothetical protein
MKLKSASLIGKMLIAAIIFLFTISCEKSETNNEPNGDEPIMTTRICEYGTQNTVVCGGKITDTQSGTLSACGVCWGTNPNPTINDQKTTDTPLSDNSYRSYVRGLSPSTTYYIRAYATTEKGTGYGEEISFTSSPSGTYNIGMEFQGGLIAYILQPSEQGYESGKVKGLITTATDQSSGATWDKGSHSDIETSNGIFENIGDGKVNTENIVNAIGSGEYAASICNDLDYGGYTDWYLPCIYEMGMVYNNRIAIGGFRGAFYWSSSNHNESNGYCLSNSAIGVYSMIYMKELNANVRAVRFFAVDK